MGFASSIASTMKDIFNSIAIVKVEDILIDIQACMDNINKLVLPSLDHLSKSIDAIKDKKGLLELGRDLNIPGRDPNLIIKNYREFFVQAETCLHTIYRIVEKDFPDIVTEKTTTFKVGTAVKIVKDISSMSMFCLDIIYYAICNPKEIDDGYTKHITKHRHSFCTLYRLYSKELLKITKEISDVSNEVIHLSSPYGFLDTQAKRTGKMINLPDELHSNFINNPIYHIRLWLMDRDINKYNANKDKKEMLELKVLSLKLAKDDPNADIEKLNKQIEYYENKITDLNYKIERFENE